jgi:hypothetical protein
MNTWGYFILITALLVLAGVMLYARFATRSREKSLHHAPSDWCFGSETLDIPTMSVDAEESEVRAQIRLDRVSGEQETPASPALPRDYLDELQEAAAGLAKLMRSSPAARPEPVVYAPVTVTDGTEAHETSASSEESAADETMTVAGLMELEESEEPAVPEVEVHHEPTTATPSLAEEVPVMETEEPSSEPDVVDSREEVVFVSMEPVAGESVVAVEDDVVVAEEFPAPKVLSLRELLGDTVADQFDRIDAGLDALEDLVASIEENLILLTDYERGADDSDSAGEEIDRVAAAA